MILNFFRSGDWTSAMIGVCVSIFVVFCTLPIHEYAHAWMSTRLGDDTARLSGRLTLNPLAHIDPIGAVMILLIGFGYAKPVPVNMRNFKNPKAGMAVTALAGPVSNLLAGFAAALLYNVAAIVATNVSLSTGAWELISIFFIYFISINISLAVFNLIPIPPLDGSKILFAFLPDRIVYKAYQNEQVLSIVLIVLIFTGVLTGPLSYLQNILTNWVFHLASLPFAAFW